MGVLEEHSMAAEDLVSLEPSGETAQASTAPKPSTSSDISVGVVSDTATRRSISSSLIKIFPLDGDANYKIYCDNGETQKTSVTLTQRSG